MEAAGITDPDQTVTNSLTSGSITTDMTLGNSPGGNFDTIVGNYQSNVGANNLNGLNILSSSTSIQGQTTTTSDDSVNLGLILGISIPLVILRKVVVK